MLQTTVWTCFLIPNLAESRELALNIFRDIGERSLEATILYSTAEIYKQLNYLDKSRENCEQALIIATELNIPLIEELYELQAKLETS